MAKCPTCNGTGRTQMVTLVQGADFPCIECNGTGEVEMTNEYFMRTATTEQLAWFIADVCYELQDDIWSNCEDTSCDYRQTDKNYWLEWLKEKCDEQTDSYDA